MIIYFIRIIQFKRGTVAILKHLKNQIAEKVVEEPVCDEKEILRSNIIKSTKVFDLRYLVRNNLPKNFLLF